MVCSTCQKQYDCWYTNNPSSQALMEKGVIFRCNDYCPIEGAGLAPEDNSGPYQIYYIKGGRLHTTKEAPDVRKEDVERQSIWSGSYIEREESSGDGDPENVC